MWQICDRLFLAQLPMIVGETRKDNFIKFKIKHVLTVSTESIPTSKQVEGVRYNFLHLFDLPSQDILENGLLLNGLDLIINATSINENIVVHCVAGVSRSVSFCTAYLMFKNRWTLEKSLEFIQNIRPAAGPNEGFMSQLKVFERCNFSREVNIYKSVKLEVPAIDSGPSYFYRQPVSSKVDIIRFKCRTCRKLLFNIENVLHIGDANNCQKYLIEPMEWLSLNSSTSNITHSCGAKLGHFVAVGLKCSGCSTFVAPWICIDKSKIDRLEAAKNEIAVS